MKIELTAEEISAIHDIRRMFPAPNSETTRALCALSDRITEMETSEEAEPDRFGFRG